jgi:hypothetical protein
MRPTHRIEDFFDIAATYEGNYPWMQVGVFPTELDDENSSTLDWFNYTVGLGGAELWVSCVSIEGRRGGNELLAPILNVLAAAWKHGPLGYGDQVIVPLGVPGGEDADAIFWVGDMRENANRRQVNMSPSEWCVPILWSSPLGWDE